jgi:hypothetical protein
MHLVYQGIDVIELEFDEFNDSPSARVLQGLKLSKDLVVKKQLGQKEEAF